MNRNTFLAMALTIVAASNRAPAEIEIIAVDEQPWYVAEDRAVARELVSPRNSPAKGMSIAEIIVPEGVTITPHHHVMEEVYLIVEGEGLVMIEDEVARVRAGDSVVIAPHQWHNIHNDGETEIRMLVTCVPAWAPEHLLFERDAMPEDAGAPTPDDL